MSEPTIISVQRSQSEWESMLIALESAHSATAYLYSAQGGDAKSVVYAGHLSRLLVELEVHAAWMRKAIHHEDAT